MFPTGCRTAELLSGILQRTLRRMFADEVRAADRAAETAVAVLRKVLRVEEHAVNIIDGEELSTSPVQSHLRQQQQASLQWAPRFSLEGRPPHDVGQPAIQPERRKPSAESVSQP